MNTTIAALSLLLGFGKKPEEKPPRPGTPRPSFLTIPQDSRPLSPLPTKGSIDRSFSFSLDRTIATGEKRVCELPDFVYQDEE